MTPVTETAAAVISVAAAITAAASTGSIDAERLRLLVARAVMTFTRQRSRTSGTRPMSTPGRIASEIAPR